jgi:hypothetical protein
MTSDLTPPDLIPLRLDHAYVRATPTSPYWSLAPHAIQQHTDASCSLATATMLVNAVRGHEGQLKVGAPASELSLLDRLKDEVWRAAIHHETGHGQTLTEFAGAMTRALVSFDCAARWHVEPMPVMDAESCLPVLRATLIALENGATGFVASNFHLDLFYGDGTDIGHFSPIGAYDAASDRVLMLDVYKKDYEPMWAPLPRLAKAMATRSVRTGEPRGYVVVSRAG